MPVRTGLGGWPRHPGSRPGGLAGTSSALVVPPANLATGRVGFALAPFARLFVVSVLSQVGKDPRLLALLLEALQRPLEGLIAVDDHLRHPATSTDTLRRRWKREAYT